MANLQNETETQNEKSPAGNYHHVSVKDGDHFHWRFKEIFHRKLSGRFRALSAVQSANMSYTRPENPTPPTVTEGQKRKRGRPKKQPQADTVEPLAEKKPRGRPKGSKKTTPVTAETVKPPAGKRGRGRPRKWPQAVVQEGESEEGNSQGSSDSNLNSSPGTQGLKLGITGKDSSRSGKTAGLKRSPSTFSATAE